MRSGVADLEVNCSGICLATHVVQPRLDAISSRRQAPTLPVYQRQVQRIILLAPAKLERDDDGGKNPALRPLIDRLAFVVPDVQVIQRSARNEAQGLVGIIAQRDSGE